MGQSYSLRLAVFSVWSSAFTPYLIGPKAPPKGGTPNLVLMKPTIMKFGGTSVEDATAIRSVAAIVKLAVNSRPVVIVSAIGGFTNSLLASVAKAIDGDARAATK